MPGDQQGRRRRRRSRRRGSHAIERQVAGQGATERASRARRPEARQPLAQWNWRTFPVLFAFVAGVVLMGFAAMVGPTLFAVVFFAGLFGVAFCLAHIVTRVIIAGRRQQGERDSRPSTGSE
ncbi:MAG: hypothetical protein IH866_00715 [Chloroflexi bacterium]|nr:hypothetical protein [Chloroflexota bacterium]